MTEKLDPVAELQTLAATGKRFGDFWILPLTLKECAEIHPDIGHLLVDYVWSQEQPEVRAALEKWLPRKIRDLQGNPVTLETLIEKDFTAPWLRAMITSLLDSSGFPLPKEA